MLFDVIRCGSLFVVGCVLAVRCSVRFVTGVAVRNLLLSVVVCNGCYLLSVAVCCGCCLLLFFTTEVAVVCG